MAAGYSSLRIIQPPASEPVTIGQARGHCRIDNDYDDTLVSMYVTSARTWAETWLNRALFTQQLQFSITWAPPPTATPLVPQSLIVFPLNWPPLVKLPIELPRAPVRSVDAVLWGAVDDMQPADPDDYVTNLAVEPAYLAVKPQILPMIPQQSMIITYTAGYSDADVSVIPVPIIHAILILTAFLYEQRGDVNSDMPAAAKALMWPYRLWTFSA